MQNFDNSDPQFLFSQLACEAFDPAWTPESGPSLPPPEVVDACIRGWSLYPQVQGAAVQPITAGQATDNLYHISEWVEEYPGCDWILKTGAVSRVIVLEADDETALGVARALADQDCPETLVARAGGTILAFFIYPAGMRARKPGRIVLGRGLAVRADEDQIFLPRRVDGAWPNVGADVQEAPDWLRDCGFKPM